MVRKISEKEAAHGLDCHFCEELATHIVSSNNCPTCGSEVRVCNAHLLQVAVEALEALGLTVNLEV